MHSEVPRFAGKRRAARSLFVSGFACLALAGSAEAADFTVTNLANSGDGSLRDAVADADSAGGADRVLFQPGLTGEIFLSGHIQIAGALEIVGPGPGEIAIDGSDASRLFFTLNVPEPGVEISGLTLRDGGVPAGPGECGCGGAILNNASTVVVRDSTFFSNHATWGGAIESYQGDLTVETSTFTENSSSHEFGGGAIHVGEGTATISQSTFLDNDATFFGGAIHSGDAKTTVRDSTIAGSTAGDSGGGISINGGKVKMINSTATDNTAGAYGGGVGTSGKLVIKSSTLAENTAARGGGVSGDEVMKLSSSIVADNTASIKGPDAVGVFKSNYSLIESRQKAKIKGRKNIIGKDPKLGEFDEFGGPTNTIELLAGSRAINKGAKSAPPLDQRGYPRDNKPDIGAFEFDAMP